VSARRLVALALAVAGLLLGPAAAGTAATPAQRAVAYLERAQNGDGGYGFEPRSQTTPIATHWVAIGLRAAGRDPADVRQLGGDTLAEAVARTATAELDDASTTARAILALRATGGASTLVPRLLELQLPDGSFDGRVTTTAFGIFALRAAGRAPGDDAMRRATGWLAGQQNDDGGFSAAGRGGASGVDDTAAAVQGLLRGGRGRGSAPVRRALRWLVARQRADGGFPLLPGQASNAQSTAWAIQALAAAGRDPRRLRRRGGRDPIAFLRTLQARDGSFRYSRSSVQTPVWVTAQALLGLARRPF
jgi:hypothetical protein